ncbi:MAG TPA: hypothetical protein VGD45_01935 [Steroidobacter sp.]|uniref:hypothetical protein n=1 Tax=Steroidobacter sp. TaxID=1978227 RepID=UPI002EDB7E29
MEIRDALEVGSVVIASLGGGALLIFAMSNWLGRVWADRLMQAERAKHDAELEQLRAQLHTKTSNEIELVKRRLDIATTSHLREVQEKIAIYRSVIDLVSEILGDFDRTYLDGKLSPDAQTRYDRFNRGRMKAYGYMAMLAPQAVMDSFDAVVDHLMMIWNGSEPYEWTKVRTLAIAMINAIRQDIGLDKAPIEYRGKL